MSECRRGQAPSPQTPEGLLLLLDLHMTAAAIFLWYLEWREWVGEIPTACSVVCLSHANILWLLMKMISS